MSITKVCPICGKEFKTKQSRIDDGRGKFCSRKCAQASRARPIARICRNCGKQFKTCQSQIDHGRGKFCSKKCLDTSMPRLIRTCQFCGKEFTVKRSAIIYGRGKFCSHSCQRKKEPIPIEKRFWRYVEMTDGCWLWTGSRNSKGYGLIDDNSGRSLRAHRVSWKIHFGPISPGLQVLHKCDNPPCVNPAHLFLGSSLDNTRDCISKNRFPSKLTSSQVIKIRQRFADGDITRQQLADEFNVDRSTIGLIIRRKTWKHLP